MHEQVRRSALVGTFTDVSPDDLAAIDARLEPLSFRRGETLVSPDDVTADALYIVVSGRFEVLHADNGEAVAEIGPGNPIGEIAFFAGGRRTATVKAKRDSVVLRLKRADFEELARERPRLWQASSIALARRLMTTAVPKPRPRAANPSTICVIHAGAEPSPEFLANLRVGLSKRVRAAYVSSDDARALANGTDAVQAEPLDALERSNDAVVYIADDTLTPWSEAAIRQTDLVLAVAHNHAAAAGSDRLLNPLERYAATIHRPGKIALAILHPPGSGIRETRAWLAERPFVRLWHHLRHGVEADFDRLCRFLTGTARGLVACGGGAFSAAHIGCYQALIEAGTKIDAVGGTSGGAAMGAAFALGIPPDEIERRLNDIFVVRRSMRRWTLPRYSLIDHAALDRALAEHFTDIDIADLPIPYFALSTNLTRGTAHVHRDGPLWQAVRASSSIPALLPPRFTADGDMLVDGCLVDNVPIGAMHALKLGPNVVVDFQVPEPAHENRGGNDELPSRWELVRAAFSKRSRAKLPPVPGPQTVLVRSLLLHGRCDPAQLNSDDLLISPPMPRGIAHLDWHRHRELRAAAHEFTAAVVAALRSEGHPALAI